MFEEQHHFIVQLLMVGDAQKIQNRLNPVAYSYGM